MTVEPTVSQVANTAVTSNSSAIHSKRIHRHEQYASVDLEWQPQLPATWTVLRLKHLVSLKKRPVRETDQIVTCFRDGTVTLRANRRTDGFTNADKEIGYQGVRKGDLVIHAMDAFAGAIGVSDSDGKSTPVYSVCAPLRNKANSRFLAYALRDMARRGYITALGQGIRERSTDFRWSNAAEVKLPVPPLEEQRRIAAFLDYETARIDELVHEQEQLLALLKEREDVLITNLVTQGLDPNLDRRDSGYSVLGSIPAHWKVARLKHLLRTPLSYGANEAAVENDTTLPRYIRITDIDDHGKLRDSTFKSLPWEVAKPYLLEDRDLLLARSGATVGKSFLYRQDFGPASFAGYLIRASFDRRKLIPEYAEMYFKSRPYWEYIDGSNIQATIQNVSAEKYSNCPIPVPPIEEQWAILEKLNNDLRSSHKLRTLAVASIKHLLERRSALISAAVTGQLDLRNWQPPEHAEAAEVA